MTFYDSEPVHIESLAYFYRPDQARDRGRFADEGRARQGLVNKTPSASDSAAKRDPSYNLGVTPYRGKPVHEVAGVEGYYQSNRYKGWLTDLKAEAQRTGVVVQDVVKVAGVWLGNSEPSASVWVQGTPEKVRALASSLGSEYNQEGVMLFHGDNDDGMGALYTLPGLQDRDKAVAALAHAGIDGGRVVQSKGGGYVLEVADKDGSMYDKILATAKELGADVYATPGKVEFLSGGTDYQRRPRPHKGAGITHAAMSLQGVA